MASPAHTNIVYIVGTDVSNLPPDARIHVKIGMSKNNPANHAQRIGEHKRHLGDDIEHAYFTTNQGDAAVRKFLCSRYPNKFGQTSAREVVSLLAEDLPFLIDQATRYFNAVNAGSSPYDANVKLESFLLRAEQIACLDKTEAWMRDPTNLGYAFLWDCKMRFGKTHTTYELIMRMDLNTILILTNRPTDTKKAWIDAMDHVDFDFGVDNFIDASTCKDVIIPKPGERTIIFASLQDYARTLEQGLKNKFSHLPNITIDLIVCDECHIAFETQNTRDAIAKLTYKHMLHLSGTPFKALLDGKFDDDAKFTWSYINEQHARTAEIEAVSVLNSGLVEKDGQYYWLCPMKIFTILLSAELYEEASQFTEDEGFTFTKLFATEEKNGELTWVNGTAVQLLLDAMCRGEVMPYSKQAHNSRQYDAVCLKHVLWHLPGVKEAKLLAKMLRKHKIFKHYDIIDATGDNGGEGSNTVEIVKDHILRIEEKNPRNTKHVGTITLTCGKLTHGVSIPEWGSVFILSDMSSPQLYFQLIFRGQTPWKVGNKQWCYVFDFNPNRTLNHFNTLASTIAGSGDVNSILSEMLKVFNVVCYEGNMFKTLDASDLVSKLDAGFGRSTSLFGLQTLLSELAFDVDDMDLSNDLCDIEGSSGSKAKEVKVSENPDTPNGKNKKRMSGDDDDSEDTDDSEDDSKDSSQPKTDQEFSDEQKKERVRSALRAVPLYWLCTGDESFDDLVDNLVQANDSKCRAMTGLQARSLKKILSGQSAEKKSVINEAIRRFRSYETKDNDVFQKEMSDIG